MHTNEQATFGYLAALGFTAGLFLAAAASVASACDGLSCAPEAAPVCSCELQPPSDSAPAKASGMRVAIDPATGEFVDAPVVAPQAQAGIGVLDAPVRERALAEGGFVLEREGGFRHYMVAEAAPGGVPRTRCSDKPVEAAQR